jgi:UDP-glucose 4-epimerase
MAVLITGGAGYIGSHMIYALENRDERMVVLDNLSTGVRALVSPKAAMIEGDVADQKLVRRLIGEYGVDAVVHFAASSLVEDSMADPLGYYANNTVASRALIETCMEAGVRYFVFSSSAAIYGNGGDVLLTEDAAKDPINPYGRSKLMTEWMLEDISRARDFRSITLRYFNVAGADPLGRTGETVQRATHLVKVACQTALGRRPELEIFGGDYPTRDGTCVRDYVHVGDVVSAHVLALDALRGGARTAAYNVGYGSGFTVREVLAAVERVAGRKVPAREAARRAGDPATLVADPSKLKRALNWTPRFADLDTIVAHAYEWERRLS